MLCNMDCVRRRPGTTGRRTLALYARAIAALVGAMIHNTGLWVLLDEVFLARRFADCSYFLRPNSGLSLSLSLSLCLMCQTRPLTYLSARYLYSPTGIYLRLYCARKFMNDLGLADGWHGW